MLRAAHLVFVFAVCAPLAGYNMRRAAEPPVTQCYTCEDAACEQPPLELVSCSPTQIYCYTLVRRGELSDEHVREVYGDDTYVGKVKRRGCTSACVFSTWEGYTCVQCPNNSCNDAGHRANIARPAGAAPLNSSQEKTTWEELDALWSIVTSDTRFATVALICSVTALVVLAVSCYCACHLARYAYHIVVKNLRRLRSKKERSHVRSADAEAENTPLVGEVRQANTVDGNETAVFNVSFAGRLDNIVHSVAPDVGESPNTQPENTVSSSTVALNENPSSPVSINAESAPLERNESFRAASAPATPLFNRIDTIAYNDAEPEEEISGSCASIDSQGQVMGGVNQAWEERESAQNPSPALPAYRAPSPTEPLTRLEETEL